MIRQLRLQPHLAVQSVKLDNPRVPAAARDDGAVLEDADGEDRAVVDLPDDLGHGVVAPAPDEHVAVTVARDDVTVTGVGKTGHILQ